MYHNFSAKYFLNDPTDFDDIFFKCRNLDCSEPQALEGPMCLAYLPRYRWNNIQQRCVRFIYGGCRGTANNFETQKECEHVAGKICRLSSD
ncbi:hypothetical protein NQ315_001999 [Exocentrus adspersus]|uniref:BPTI/Kunitz inhibitor domain-containing protein n=1 Tax=Exocentrus adspersus TaxID=1586481 RepID=A0AAV8W9Z3_9CUCU|nr:hypothetical protein NQ315_001999 [Exocentrus adspersus]